MKIRFDVFVLTKNSEEYLDECLTAIREQKDYVNNLIIIDGKSRDKTMLIAKKHADIFLSDFGLGLGYARSLAIRICQTEWICFIDSDCIIKKDWFKDMIKYIRKDVGGIQARPRYIALNYWEKRVYRVINRRNNRKKIICLKPPKDRGFTGATLIRKDLVNDVKMPYINCFEDYILSRHVLFKGYKWLNVPVRIFHYDRMFQRWLRTKIGFATYRCLGKHKSIINFILGRLDVFIRGMILSIREREPYYVSFQIKLFRGSIIGFLKWNEYIKLEYPA